MFHSVPTQNYKRKTVDKCPVPGLTFAYLCENSLFAKTQAKMIKEILKNLKKRLKKIFFSSNYSKILKIYFIIELRVFIRF